MISSDYWSPSLNVATSPATRTVGLLTLIIISTLPASPSRWLASSAAAGRNILRQPGIANWDMGLAKNFAMTERASFQFRIEAFNTFNHAQYGLDPSTTTGIRLRSTTMSTTHCSGRWLQRDQVEFCN